MKESCVKKEQLFLSFIQTVNTEQRKAILKTLTSSQVQALCEVTLNALKGTFPLPQVFCNKIKRHKDSLRLLVGSQIGVIKKKAILLKLHVYIHTILKFSRPVLLKIWRKTSL
jgi:hypothetical protein